MRAERAFETRDVATSRARRAASIIAIAIVRIASAVATA
jgi:hypothetical protein